MELIPIIILLISLLLFALQMTFFERKWCQWAYLGVIAIGIYLCYPMAIDESYNSIRETISNTKLINNFSALVIAEGLFGCLLSIFQIRLLFGQRIKKWWKYAFYFSGIVFFISIYFLETLLFINIRGIDFVVLAIMLSLIIPLIILGTKWFLQWLVPQKDLRTELKFFLHLAQILFDIVLSVIVLKLPVNTSQHNNNFLQLITILSVGIFIATAGYIYHFIKTKKTYGNSN